MSDKSIFLFLILTVSVYFISIPCYSETDTLQQGQQLKDWDYLISSNKVFILKFFSLGTSTSPYLGTFYKKRGPVYLDFYDFPNNAVWVANRNNPVPDISVNLMIDVTGKLSILSSGGTIHDLFSPTPVTGNASATLLDSGNFLLQELHPDGSTKQILWQSFDYPTDTLLPGMKLGTDLKTGRRWSLTSWAGYQLPAQGSFTLTGDPNGTGQLLILRRGNIHWMSGPWQNGEFKNTDLQSAGPDVHFYYISNETEESIMYLTRTYDSLPALRMYPDGQLKGSSLHLEVHCALIRDSGCVEYEFEKLDCRKDYDFGGRNHYIYTDEYEYDASDNLTLHDCKRICWNNCSCIAYTYATKDKTGCKTYGKMVYDPAQTNNQDTEYHAVVYYGGKKKKWIWLIIGVGSVPPLLACYFVEKKLHFRGKAKKIQKLLLKQLRRLYNNEPTNTTMNIELHFFTFQSISSATNSFSSTNKLGEGGFGAVYKGKLADGQEIAVKRLSRSSRQGVTEFMNETQLIAKLQHTNLVRLLGCCIEKQEKILVYEYMPNHSLDYFIFGKKISTNR